ncbi:MAG: hypothetical protein ACPGPE_12285 [Planctomycetota bacterium]|jgi:hypothetical protein
MTDLPEHMAILSQGKFQTVNRQRIRLERAGLEARVICPPGVDPNG